MIKNKLVKETIKIQRADLGFINELIDICRKCFPSSLMEIAPRPIAQKRWKLLLTSPSVETYLISVNNKIVGFYVIIIDLFGYTQERANISLFNKIVFFIGEVSGILSHPYLVGYIINKLKKRLNFSIKKKSILDGSQMKDAALNKTVWGELQGILPDYQGKGLAKCMQQFILNRSIEINKEFIAGNVEADNLGTRALLESFGYIATSESYAGIIYKKPLK